MSEILDIKKWYISNFEKFENNLNGGSLKPIHQVRKEAIAKFSNSLIFQLHLMKIGGLQILCLY